MKNLLKNNKNGDKKMKRISVYFKDIKLGELSMINDEYIYLAIKENIDKATKKGYSKTLYGCDKNFVSKTLPFSLKNFVVENDQIKNWSEANINTKDSNFERLLKVAKLNDIAHDDFYITVE